MDVTEVLQFVDKLVFERTGKHLDDVQKSIVEGTWQRQTYHDIAQECKVSKNHASDVGAELWQILSDALGEDIKKSNSRSALERVYIRSLKNSNVVINGDNNHLCPTETQKSPNENNLESNDHSQSNSTYHDLTLAPQIICFYDRETELENLFNWILKKILV